MSGRRSAHARRYDLKSRGLLPAAAAERVPDAYAHNGNLSSDVLALQQQLADARAIAAKASATWDSFRKERDHHRMHHKRVLQEKNRLIQARVVRDGPG